MPVRQDEVKAQAEYGLALVVVAARRGRFTPRHVHLSTRLLRAAEGELDGSLVPAPSTVVG